MCSSGVRSGYRIGRASKGAGSRGCSDVVLWALEPLIPVATPLHRADAVVQPKNQIHQPCKQVKAQKMKSTGSVPMTVDRIDRSKVRSDLVEQEVASRKTRRASLEGVHLKPHLIRRPGRARDSRRYWVPTACRFDRDETYCECDPELCAHVRNHLAPRSQHRAALVFSLGEHRLHGPTGSRSPPRAKPPRTSRWVLKPQSPVRSHRVGCLRIKRWPLALTVPR